jgi:hypothetical protein
MEAILKNNLSIDKTKWTNVKFGDIVMSPKNPLKIMLGMV